MLREETANGGSGGPIGAISLTYDGADYSHLEVAIPALQELGFRGTFFLSSAELLAQAREWVNAHHSGHEMGSHSLLGFTDERGNLHNWTLDMVESDLRMSRKLLTDLFSRQTDFPFAYPGDQTGCVAYPYDPSPTSYEEVAIRLFRVTRRSIGGFNKQQDLDVNRLRSIDAQGLTYREMVDLANEAIAQSAWAIFAFGAIGSGDPGTDRSHHSAFLSWLKDRESEVTIAPMWEQAMRILAPSEMHFQRHDF